MNRLTPERRVQIVAALVEGNSIRATCRMTDTAKGTVLKLLTDLGPVCAAYQDAKLRNLPCKRIQVDEIWSFSYGKDKNLPAHLKDTWGYGGVWTWTALCADTKLVPSWLLGDRSAFTAMTFLEDLARRLTSRVQLSSDGHVAYMSAVEHAFGSDIDYAQVIKLYGNERDQEARYSPGECIGAVIKPITGNPDTKHISTSYVERQNLTMRMHMRRFTCLTNAFSKKWENLDHALSLHYMHYNFVRVHQTLGTTPAVAAGVTDHEWSIHEIIGLLLVAERLERDAASVKSGRN